MLYKEIQESGARIVAVLLTPWDSHMLGKTEKMQSQTKQLNDWIRKHPGPSVVVDTTRLGGQTVDGLHLTRAGGEQLAEMVLEAFA